jgi:hypothetical protein
MPLVGHLAHLDKDDVPNFGSVHYWEKRYIKERIDNGRHFMYDWYLPFAKGIV